MAHGGRLVRPGPPCIDDLKIEQHIVTSNSNFNFNPGGNVINNNSVNNSVQSNISHYHVTPEATPNPIAKIEKSK